MVRLRTAAAHVGVFAGLLAALYLMMVLFAAIPNAALKNNMLDSIRYHLEMDRYEVPESGVFQGVADNYADQIWLNVAWQMGEGNPFEATLDTWYYDGDRYGEISGLYHTIMGHSEPNQDYSRYWHASAAVLRVFHLFTDIQGAKTLCTLAMLLLIINTLRLLFRNGNGDAAMCLLVSLLLVQIWNVRLSYEYQPCFLICFALCPVYLKWERQGDRGLTVLAVISGTLTAVFDFLTVETMTILVPLILIVAIRSMEGRLRSKAGTAKLLMHCLLAWGSAYVGSFLVKWWAVSMVTGENRFAGAWGFAGERFGGKVTIQGTEKTPGILRGISANLSVLFGGVGREGFWEIVVGLILCGLLVYGLFHMYRSRRNWSRGSGFLLGLGALVLLRYSVLNNHSYLHAFFTYRALISTILALLTMLMLNLRPRRLGRRRK